MDFDETEVEWVRLPLAVKKSKICTSEVTKVHDFNAFD